MESGGWVMQDLTCHVRIWVLSPGCWRTFSLGQWHGNIPCLPDRSHSGLRAMEALEGWWENGDREGGYCNSPGEKWWGWGEGDMDSTKPSSKTSEWWSIQTHSLPEMSRPHWRHCMPSRPALSPSFNYITSYHYIYFFLSIVTSSNILFIFLLAFYQINLKLHEDRGLLSLSTVVSLIIHH